ncbi:MAG: GNAT family N-acetyltransferase/peptidase C39 family protein [Pseudomonadota bacterium]
MTDDGITLREAKPDDLDALIALETAAFSTDRLSRRSFRHWINNTDSRAFLVASADGALAGYILVIYHAGTRLARLYSIATDPRFRGRGIARRLIEAGEQAASDNERFIMRLEVGAENRNAIRLYESLGYTRFGVYHDYYDDHSDALRMQKRIHQYRVREQHMEMPWIRQSTPFTCGPAALMMAMSGVDAGYVPSPHEELQIWREATTIFMTSGHGGCHPLGLALAAQQRGFNAEVWINTRKPLFVDSVRDPNKKHIIELVHKDYLGQAKATGLRIHFADIKQNQLTDALHHKAIPLVMISTWRLEGKKAPHWVTVSGYDSDCLYVHDPDPEEISQSALDCQYLPIAREDFARISLFGQQRLRTAVIISRKPAA